MNKDERRGIPDGVGGILSRDTKRLEYVLEGQPVMDSLVGIRDRT